jgi:hypothetical protein
VGGGLSFATQTYSFRVRSNTSWVRRFFCSDAGFCVPGWTLTHGVQVRISHPHRAEASAGKAVSDRSRFQALQTPVDWLVRVVERPGARIIFNALARAVRFILSMF